MNLKTKLFGGILLVFLSIANINAQDQMLGEIRIFAGNFAPRGWAFCDGQLLPISQNSALFSLLGTMYGGDGRTTFGLPDLRGRAVVSAGRGPGLQNYVQGARGGTEYKTLSVAQMPQHSHILSLSNLRGGVDIPINTVEGEADDNSPATAVMAVNANEDTYSNTITPNAKYGGQTIPVAITGQGAIANNGGSQSFDNRQPYLPIRYIIALTGYFPSRN